ncbi:MAG TPA: low-complexity tail membrane protein [Leptolyngbyaceae cyanobacterium M33_DOE_097]|uniref:Low-complexity tail membrane protein n=1 Tax=Oscillatoriales cyanobacterium SpSt-418 TaxID=2282169 RepID=A0A7C3PBU7_9CYAN|nr:low-complexity tail membrane protein [Leptolyngbyaceae cyanobacterium M33_DOE_097]
MRSFWSDPYLWLHLAGLATVPLFVDLCLTGFAMGYPIFPGWLEVLLVAVVGIAPIIWMQWQRPFYIFSVPGFALKPEILTDSQRQMLTLFKSQRNQILSVVLAVLLFFGLQWLYRASTIAAEVISPDYQNHLLGLGLAAISFLAINLFTQVPLSVINVLLHSESEFAQVPAYPVEQVRQTFSLLGLRVRQILPAIAPPEPVPTKVQPTSARQTSLTAPADLPEAMAAEDPNELEEALAEAAADAPVSEAEAETSAAPTVLSEEMEDIWDVVETETEIKTEDILISDTFSQVADDIPPADDLGVETNTVSSESDEIDK